MAYLPTTRLEHITNKAARRRAVANLFHACMGEILAPLREAGLEGIPMKSADGVERRCHPILAAYVGDYPEQILVTTAYSGDCACCDAGKGDLGAYPLVHAYRDIEAALAAVHTLGTDLWVERCREANIKPVQHPFWEALPYTSIFASITPDVLHQLYQGVMKHLIGWLTDIVGANEIDARVRRLPPNHTIRIFCKGISTLSRVSGTEHKQMCMFIIGVVTDIPGLSIHQSNMLLAATRALLDFLYLACYPIHSSDTLVQLDESLAAFHEHRQIFIDCGVRAHFNIPKLHFLSHYSRAIKYYGTTDNYNTETTERLHIDLAKDAYRASNHKDEFTQMARWLERREKIFHHTNYIAWRCTESSAVLPRLGSTSTSDGMIGGRMDFPGSQRTLLDLKCELSQKVTRFPTVKAVSLEKIQDQGGGGYGAVSFLHALKRFLVQYRDPTVPLNQVDDYARFVVLPFRSVPVWHKVKFTNAELYGKQTLDAISAHPSLYNKSGKVVRSSRFDTVLININDGQNWVKGQLRRIQTTINIHVILCSDSRIGRVRVVFTLPNDKLDTLIPPNIPPPTHLAYVEWFTKLARTPEIASGLYRVKKETTADGTCAASIIPLDSITRSIHLFPKWGGAVPPAWTCETVLDLAPSFLVNIFKDNHSYFNLT